MNTPRLPIEVCENVIDHCVSPVDAERHEDVLESYGALLAFSLTCRDLSPRSRRNLYTVVMLTCSNQADRLCVALTMKPALGEHTRVLRIDDKGGLSDNKYIPFARHEMVSKLPNVRTLVLQIDWNAYPPRYFDLVSLHYPVTDLLVWVPEFSGLDHAIPVFSKFRRLERLHVYQRLWHNDAEREILYTVNSQLELSGQATQQQMAQSSAHRHLKALMARGDDSRWSPYPPPLHTFGNLLVRLVIRRNCFRMYKRAEVSDCPCEMDLSKLARLSSQCQKLENLTLIDDFPDGQMEIENQHRIFSLWATTFISATRLHQNLREISFRLWPPRIRPPSFPRTISRVKFLRLVFDETWVTACQHLQSPRTVVFALPEASTSVDRPRVRWWETEIESRLRSSNVRVLVELTAVTDDVDTLWPCPWNDRISVEFN